MIDDSDYQSLIINQFSILNVPGFPLEYSPREGAHPGPREGLSPLWHTDPITIDQNAVG